MLLNEKFQSESEQQTPNNAINNNVEYYEDTVNPSNCSVIPEADPIIITLENFNKYVNVNTEKENFSPEIDEYATSLKVIKVIF